MGAGTAAGASVAATLLPLRAATLAVASLAGRGTAATDEHAATASTIQETPVAEGDNITERAATDANAATASAIQETPVAEEDSITEKAATGANAATASAIQETPVAE